MANEPPVTPVPLCDLQSQYRELQPEIEAAVCRVLSSGQFILGPEVTSLESETAAYCGAAFGIGCGSGSDALLLALAGMDIGPGDEVILPPFTFFATVGSVIRMGAIPVFADIDPKTYNIDPAAIAEKITPRTKAIMVVHLYGQCAEMEPIWQLGEKHGIPIIEDAAQSFGAEYQGKRCGTLGGISCFSFYPSKNLSTYGDAGMCMTSDPDWAARMRTLRGHGMDPKYFHKYVGWNARIDALHAAMLRVKLPRVDGWTSNRQMVAARYDALIERSRLDQFLSRPYQAPERRHVYNQYVVRVAYGQRDALVAHLKREQVGCEIYYPLSLHLQECIRYLGYREGDFPVSEAASKNVIALPMFPEMSLAQQERVIDCCAAFVRQSTRIAA